MSDQKDILKDMINSLAESFTEERKKQEPYKRLFKSGSTYTGLLRHLENQMIGHVLDACSIIEERQGVRVNEDQYRMLLALPLLVKLAEDDARKNEGSACCVDKAFFILSEKFIASNTQLGDK